MAVDEPETMDSLWFTATQLGRVSIEEEASGMYTAEIQFSHRSSRVFARGKNTDACLALAEAVEEARAMGAQRNKGK
ncbi:MAG: hypothetical protein ABW115_19795 [Candidatus Thiodiazotropha sp. 6PLUC6]